MPIRKRKPTSPGRRFQTVSDFAEISKGKPEKALTKSKKRSSGRNVHGRMTSRHRGGGHKQKYREIDFKRGKAGRSRWKGRRPQTRGVAMNPVDHPLGGGEGKSSGGRHPVTPWGKPEGRTRRKDKPSDKLIIRRRRRRRGSRGR